MKILVIAEHDNHTLRGTTLRTLSAAKQLGGEIHVLVLGYQCDSVVKELKLFDSIAEIIVADHSGYAHQLAENIAQFIVPLLADYTHVLVPGTSFGKNVLPRIAALKGCMQISDVIEIVNANTYKRAIYAGSIIVTVQSSDAIQFLTIQGSHFPALVESGGNVPVTLLNTVCENNLTTLVSEQKQLNDRPELASADIVISGGRGLVDKATFDRLIAIADKMGAAIGASRAAVDAGLAPNEYQVGQTGQIVSPKLYIAVGISGAMQHLAGMKDSGVIVAINKDADAPIFEAADYGLIGDLDVILPAWEAYLLPS